MTKIAIVRIHGRVRIKKEFEATLRMLHLPNKNFATVLEDTPQNKGMIQKVRDQVTFGKISDAMFSELVSKRGTLYEGPEADPTGKISYARKYFVIDGKKYEKFFRLHPPIGGYGRKGIKKPFSKSGALGDRKNKMDDLLKRMI